MRLFISLVMRPFVSLVPFLVGTFSGQASGVAAPQAPLELTAAPDTAQPAARVPHDIVLVVEVAGLDVARLRALLASELACSILSPEQAHPQAGTLLVSGTWNGELRLRYTAPQGTRLERRLAASDTAPEDTAERLDQLRLLAGNLVRNEAQELVAELRRQKAERDALTKAERDALTKAERDALTKAERDALAAAAASSSQADVAATAPQQSPARASSAASAPKVAAPPRPVLAPPAPVPECSGLPLYFSLFHPLASNSALEHGCAALVLNAAYGRVAALDGAALSLGYLRVTSRTRGFSLGMVTLTEGALRGVQLGTFTSLVYGETEGAQISAGGNISGPVRGALIGGIFNTSSGAVVGAQVAGIGNRAARVKGVQLALVNLAGEVEGAQVGLVNLAESTHGVQLGLVNVTREARGLPIGLVNIGAQHTAFSTWLQSDGLAYAGVRYGYKALYYQLSAGGHWDETPDSHSDLFVGLGVGARWPLGDVLFSEAEVFGQFRAAEPSRGQDWNYATQVRLNLGAQLGPIGLFAGAGASGEGWPDEYQVGPLFLGGFSVGN